MIFVKVLKLGGNDVDPERKGCDENFENHCIKRNKRLLSALHLLHVFVRKLIATG